MIKLMLVSRVNFFNAGLSPMSVEMVGGRNPQTRLFAIERHCGRDPRSHRHTEVLLPEPDKSQRRIRSPSCACETEAFGLLFAALLGLTPGKPARLNVAMIPALLKARSRSKPKPPKHV